MKRNSSIQKQPALLIRTLFLLVMLVVFTGGDLAVKELVNRKLKYRNDVVVVPGFWHFRYETNDDIGFSLLHDITSTMKTRNKWLLLVILQGTGTLLVIVFYFISRRWKHLFPLALVISGALGNVIDRILRGYVIDYVMWFHKQLVWPIFNLADVYTVAGAFLLFIILFFFSKELSEPVKPSYAISTDEEMSISDTDDTLEDKK
jgi:signal peptidase II